MERLLFFDEQESIRLFKNEHDLNVSAEFMHCANVQLTRYFILNTGMKIDKFICGRHTYLHSMYVMGYSNIDFSYQKSVISLFQVSINVNSHQNDVDLCWKSISGRIYDVSDTDIDCNDIVFWFEGLNPVLYNQQLYPNDIPPFKLKQLSYELTVTRLNIDCEIKLNVKEDLPVNNEEIISKIDDFINQFNEKSMRKDRKYGVVHNWKTKITTEIVYEIDLGSAGIDFLKKLLQYFSTTQWFKKVEVI